MEVIKLIDIANKGEITPFIGNIDIVNNIVLPRLSSEDGTIFNYFKKFCDKEKLLKAFSTLDIKEDVLANNINEISQALKNKLAIVEALVNNEEELIFNNIHKGFSYREIQTIKRILKKFVEYNKKVLIITDDVEFLFGLTKNLVIVNDNNYIKMSPVNWLDLKIYDYVSKPPIIDFVLNCKQRGIKIDDSFETKELLKAIYRSVDK